MQRDVTLESSNGYVHLYQDKNIKFKTLPIRTSEISLFLVDEKWIREIRMNQSERYISQFLLSSVFR